MNLQPETGFVVGDDGLIVTCSHVVQSEYAQRVGELLQDHPLATRKLPPRIWRRASAARRFWMNQASGLLAWPGLVGGSVRYSPARSDNSGGFELCEVAQD